MIHAVLLAEVSLPPAVHSHLVIAALRQEVYQLPLHVVAAHTAAHSVEVPAVVPTVVAVPTEALAVADKHTLSLHI